MRLVKSHLYLPALWRDSKFKICPGLCPHLSFFNMSTVTSPILEVIRKFPIIPHCSTNHWQAGASSPDESFKSNLESPPGQISQGQVLSEYSVSVISHITEEEVMPSFCRWFENVPQSSFSWVSSVSSLYPLAPVQGDHNWRSVMLFQRSPRKKEETHRHSGLKVNWLNYPCKTTQQSKDPDSRESIVSWKERRHWCQTDLDLSPRFPTLPKQHNLAEPPSTFSPAGRRKGYVSGKRDTMRTSYLVHKHQLWARCCMSF